MADDKLPSAANSNKPKRHVGTPRGKGKSVGVELTLERVCELLHYNPETGALTWTEARGYNLGGKPAGRIHPRGWIDVRIDGYTHRAHRLIWWIMTGEKAPTLIDHRNRNPSDNRWENLREADHAQNSWNLSKAKNNTTGYKGVSIHNATGKFQVRIRVRGKQMHIGLYDDAEAAAEAYRQAVEKHHGEFGSTG